MTSGGKLQFERNSNTAIIWVVLTLSFSCFPESEVRMATGFRCPVDGLPPLSSIPGHPPPVIGPPNSAHPGAYSCVLQNHYSELCSQLLHFFTKQHSYPTFSAIFHPETCIAFVM